MDYQKYIKNCLDDDNYELEVTKKHKERYLCPQCNEKYNMSCNCINTNYYCKRGHIWRINRTTGQRTILEYDDH